jgi:hypothetical protein
MADSLENISKKNFNNDIGMQLAGNAPRDAATGAFNRDGRRK